MNTPELLEATQSLYQGGERVLSEIENLRAGPAKEQEADSDFMIDLDDLPG